MTSSRQKENSLEVLVGEQKKKAKKIVDSTIQSILDHSRKTAFKAYIRGLKSVGEDVDSYNIGIISDRFNRDIYFLDGNTRLPYRDASHQNLKGRKSIIIMWVDGVHYEIVGRLLSGNRIQREFTHDDQLIKKLNTLLTRPHEVAESYPELIPYIPREFRNEDSDENMDDEEELESSDEDEDEEDKRYCSGSDSSYQSTSESEEGSD